MTRSKAVLFLEDGTCFQGRSFGWEGEKIGEVVFNTALTGYEEIITDPSYCGQMVAMTYPHIGNYGINREDAESFKIWVEGFIVREVSSVYSNYRAVEALEDYLRNNRVPGIEGIDTRSLVRKIRESGSMQGIISSSDFDRDSLAGKLKKAPAITGRDLVKVVNGAEEAVYRKYTVGPRSDEKPSVAVMDYGTKLNILRWLEDAGLRPVPMKGSSTLKEVLSEGVSGVLLSNGPGDPSAVRYGIDFAREVMEYVKDGNYFPVMGICLGHQLLGLGCGGRTYKLKFGHHGGNHPVKNISTGRIEITSQNHNFCLDPDSLPEGFEITHINLNDNTVEGIRHRELPVLSFQHHPEAGPGPHDSSYVFKNFADLIWEKEKT